MTVVELKQSLLEKINGLQDPEYLEMLNTMVSYKDKKFQIPDDHLAGIIKGEQDIKNGDFLTIEQLEKRYEKWLKD